MSASVAPYSLLRTAPAPFGAAPVVVNFTTAFLDGRLSIAYVPDRDMLDRASLASYLRALPAAAPEPSVAAIAQDIANELVPKWYRVSLTVDGDGLTQTIAVEDRQPDWTHPSLLSALPPSAEK